MKKHNTKSLRTFKKKIHNTTLQMLTCYDYQTAQMLNETSIDMILVGDSLGNVVLGYDTTVEVSLNEMILFSAAVKRGAPEKFVVADLPFGSYSTVDRGLQNAIALFQQSKAEALKLEGAYPWERELIERLTQVGIPVMGHIGLRPQSVHQQGGYFVHGKDQKEAKLLMSESLGLERAGAFAVVLECVEKNLAQEITDALSIPTIGIGSGEATDGQVLVLNDLLGMGKNKAPSFCQPVTNLFEAKKQWVQSYLTKDLTSPKVNPPC
jgi:3-methyl-2-oxobutanoate hydroxymethyltransferase